MLATIRDETLNVLNMQHITPNSKRWYCLDIPGSGIWKNKGAKNKVRCIVKEEWYQFYHI